ncbi:hypothetical protein HNR46_002910 [Haloferula luteola]|uniref:Uncharacterized protein n=1 Tax=Haloferula luteola TaxID=595692 RepID=A0A840V3V3_9BACT|nr:DR2241 family protein [Haloferula luteola]MBB5352662.1 hypothetical protein [Haloferula luteola]
MIAERLAQAVRDGIRQIGEVLILPDTAEAPFALCHHRDADQLDRLERHRSPSAARDLSTWAEDGHYRFTKSELSLRRGWLMLLSSAEELRTALDLFYPAGVGLWLASQEGTLDVQHLREKLDRQTGMYRFARHLSAEGAQKLVADVCGPAHCCVKRILWQLDSETPLVDSEASRFPGHLPTGRPAIPLLCREACNHLVAEARRASKAEADARHA